MRRSPLLFLALFITAFAGSGCAASGPEVTLRGEDYAVEVVTEPGELALGLMFRQGLEPGHGMLFIFPSEGPRSFWMKNMRFSIDILYFDGQRRLVNWHADVPPCRSERCPGYPSSAPARYVLELSAGEAERLGVQPGDELQIRRD